MTQPRELMLGSMQSLREAYKAGVTNPRAMVDDIIDRSAELSQNNIWITPPDSGFIEPYLAALETASIDAKPLWGIPFAVKDNIDLAGIPTTAACPAYAYTPPESAFAVHALIAAGAVPVGKTNLDQFATGLVGTRSPYGVCTHPHRPEHISGGSSAGSAVAVSLGLASFALGTDTAGSGRIPAAFNGVFGLKPSRGLVSNRGVVPACRSLDCVSLFAGSTEDLATLATILMQYDQHDPHAQQNSYANHPVHFGQWHGPLTLGVLDTQALRLDDPYQDAYARTLERLRYDTDISLTTIDYTPFAQAAKALYEGPWLNERYLVLKDLLQAAPDEILNVTREIIAAGAEFSAAELFNSIYTLAELRSSCLQELGKCDAMLTPTAKTHFHVADLAADPFGPNAELGYYTNYMNLLDFCGLAQPAADTAEQMPFGITLVADRLQDTKLLSIGSRVDAVVTGNNSNERSYIDAGTIDIAVCGAHMQGLPLNWQLTDRGGSLVTKTKTSACYKFYALEGGPPFRPGMVKAAGGSAIEGEVWRLPAAALGSFMQGIPWPLGIGKVLLADGTEVSGFVCEPGGLAGAKEITAFGGWRSYLNSLQ